jgi:hypothetical protein
LRAVARESQRFRGALLTNGIAGDVALLRRLECFPFVSADPRCPFDGLNAGKALQQRLHEDVEIPAAERKTAARECARQLPKEKTLRFECRLQVVGQFL